jgi:serine/threonine protein kinase
MRNLLKALEHIHSKGVMHRDLKPENILMRSKNKEYDLVIADFGLATKIDEENILFKRCGTPGYVAPEILLYNVKKKKIKIKIFSM